MNKEQDGGFGKLPTIFYFGLAIFLNVRSEAFDPRGIPKACRAAASEEKNNSLYKVSLRQGSLL
ncbi:hypothetical protein JMF89_04040 [Clostridiaceae bacterium UIB06]|nr:hypothetical protein [Clostridiaceae bacterium UIB06]